jgi:hypothetical protein
MLPPTLASTEASRDAMISPKDFAGNRLKGITPQTDRRGVMEEKDFPRFPIYGRSGEISL